jgi:hypothetical protein
MSQGFTLDKITQTMVSLRDAGTLAQLYATLTSNAASNAFPAFIAAVQALPNGVTNDDPFGGAVQPAQLAHVAPVSVALAGKVFGSILGDVAAGKPAHLIVANVRAVLGPTPSSKKAGASAARN